MLLALGREYDLTILPTAEAGEDWLNQHILVPPDLILLDVILPGMDGIAFLKKIRTNTLFANLSVIVISGHSEIEETRRAFLLEAVDFISKPYQEEEIQLRIRVLAHATLAQKLLANQNQVLVEENTRARDAIILGLANLAETRDNETGMHLQRTQFYVQTLVTALPQFPELSSEVGMDLDLIVRSAPLHDIGKVGIPDSVLRKPGPLTDSERKVMQEHTSIGYSVLLKADRMSGLTPLLKCASRIALCHHEKWDGSGYPYGISGRSIPIEARIMALADVFDALVNRRIYKEAFSIDAALEIMHDGRGSHFDPRLLDVFLTKTDLLADYAVSHPDPISSPSNNSTKKGDRSYVDNW